MNKLLLIALLAMACSPSVDKGTVIDKQHVPSGTSVGINATNGQPTLIFASEKWTLTVCNDDDCETWSVSPQVWATTDVGETAAKDG